MDRQTHIDLDGPSSRSFARRLAEEQATTRLWMEWGERMQRRAIAAETRARKAERGHDYWDITRALLCGAALVIVVAWLSGVKVVWPS
jgi:hypothetical protein